LNYDGTLMYLGGYNEQRYEQRNIYMLNLETESWEEQPYELQRSRAEFSIVFIDQETPMVCF
jgi:hypothetical protein